jgi:hypothetical protein
LPAGDAPVMRAENLGDTTPFTQPLLLAIANLDQRLSTTTNSADRARLTHQRARVLEQLNRAILSQGGRALRQRSPRTNCGVCATPSQVPGAAGTRPPR